jgi:hypothetical protein
VGCKTRSASQIGLILRFEHILGTTGPRRASWCGCGFGRRGHRVRATRRLEELMGVAHAHGVGSCPGITSASTRTGTSCLQGYMSEWSPEREKDEAVERFHQLTWEQVRRLSEEMENHEKGHRNRYVHLQKRRCRSAERHRMRRNDCRRGTEVRGARLSPRRTPRQRRDMECASRRQA